MCAATGQGKEDIKDRSAASAGVTVAFRLPMRSKMRLKAPNPIVLCAIAIGVPVDTHTCDAEATFSKLTCYSQVASIV